jgi:hypothetical protein
LPKLADFFSRINWICGVSIGGRLRNDIVDNLRMIFTKEVFIFMIMKRLGRTRERNSTFTDYEIINIINKLGKP